MSNVFLNDLKLFDQSPERLLAISDEYRELADFAEGEGSTVVAATLRRLADLCEHAAPVVEMERELGAMQPKQVSDSRGRIDASRVRLTSLRQRRPN